MPQNTRITIGLENYRFTMQNTIIEDKLTNTFASGDVMTGDAPTARTGLSLCHRVILDSVAHWWVLARTPTVHQCLYGGRPWVDTLLATPPKRQDQGLQRHALVTSMFAEPVCCDRAWGQEQFTSPPPIQEGPNRKSGSSTSSRILKSTRHAANTHVQQVVNTVEVKTPRIIKKTVQGDKVDPDDDQSGKDQSGDQTGRDSSDSVRRVSKIAQQVSNTQRQVEACASQDRIQLRTVVGVHDQHDQHDVHTVMMEHPKIIKNTVKIKNPIIQEKINQARCKAKFVAFKQKPWKSNRMEDVPVRTKG